MTDHVHDIIIPDPPLPASYLVEATHHDPLRSRTWTNIVSWGTTDTLVHFIQSDGQVRVISVSNYEVVTVIPVHPVA